MALALHNKTVILSQMNNENALLDTCELIIEKFAHFNDEMIQKHSFHQLKL